MNNNNPLNYHTVYQMSELQNLLLLLVGVPVMIVGFVFMCGGPAEAWEFVLQVVETLRSGRP